MALLYNGFRQVRGHLFGVTAMDGANPSMMESRWHTTARMRNQLVGNGITSRLASVPAGNNPPVAWVMPQKAGALSSNYNAEMSIGAMASILGGKALEGSATLTIETNTPDGELIAFGIGSVTITLSTNNPLLTASVNGGGTASFTIDTNLPILGAEASIVGTTTITISVADADILPVNDDPVLREATASMSFSGTLQPYAVGHMDGTTEEQGLTVAGITNSVWNAALSNYDIAGSAGKALATASSGGVDLDLMAQAVWEYVSRTLTSGGGGATPEQIAAAILAAAQVTPIHSNMKQTNDEEIIGDGTEGNKFRSSLVP